MRNTMRAMWGGTILAAVSGLALACPPGEEGTSETHDGVWIGSFDEHLGNGEHAVRFAPAAGQWADGGGVFALTLAPFAGASGGEGAWSYRFERQQDGQDEFTVIEENGKRTVIHNGKKLSEEEAAELHKQLSEAYHAGGHASGHLDLHVSPGQDGTLTISPRVQGPAMGMMQPKVMVGITMAEPGEALRAHLGLGDRPVIMLDGVIDGLPAAEAGLKKFDIILAIDESDHNVTRERLHEVLMSKSPGEELVLRVQRGAAKETYRVKLKAYDANTLGIAPEAKEEAMVVEEHKAAQYAEHAARLHEMTQRLRESGLDEEQIAGVQRQVELALQQAWHATEEAVAATREATRAGEFYGLAVPGPDGRMLELKVPDLSNIEVPDALRERIARFGGESSDLEARLSELEKRMDEMSAQFEERMERTLHRFEQLTERLERRLGDGG